MASIREELANEIVTDISDQSFVREFGIIFTWKPHYQLEDLQLTRVTVTPTGLTKTAESRGHLRHVIVIDVGVQMLLTDDSDIGVLSQLTDELIDELIGKAGKVKSYSLTNADVVWIGVEVDPLLSIIHFEQFDVYTSVARHSYLTITKR